MPSSPPPKVVAWPQKFHLLGVIQRGFALSVETERTDGREHFLNAGGQKTAGRSVPDPRSPSHPELTQAKNGSATSAKKSISSPLGPIRPAGAQKEQQCRRQGKTKMKKPVLRTGAKKGLSHKKRKEDTHRRAGVASCLAPSLRSPFHLAYYELVQLSQ